MIMTESSDSSLSVLLLEQVYGCLFYMKSRTCQGDGLVNQDTDRSHGDLTVIQGSLHKAQKSPEALDGVTDMSGNFTARSPCREM